MAKKIQKIKAINPQDNPYVELGRLLFNKGTNQVSMQFNIDLQKEPRMKKELATTLRQIAENMEK